MIANDSPYGLASSIASLINKKNGFFIEAGANNGIWQSNSLYLETELGWSGLLIEPNKNKFEECKKNRASTNLFYNCALVDNKYKEGFIEGYFNEEDYENSLMAQVCVDNPEFSSDDPRWHGKQSTLVPAKTLSGILKENNVTTIDFLSLDVEGYELHVLNGLDFSSHAPELMCVEIRNQSSPDNLFEIKNLLESNSYLLLSTVGHNYIFQRMI